MPPTTAARWMTTCGRFSANSRCTSGSCVRSYSAFRTTMMSRQPCRSNADTTWRPRNPLPPVMSTRLVETSMTPTSRLGHRALDDVTPDDEDIHVRAEEAIERLPGTQHNGFI